MFVIIGAGAFFAVLVLTVLVALGYPLGEFTMGGKHKILPRAFRVLAVVSALIQLFAIVIVLQAGGWVPLWFGAETTRIICFVFAGYLSLNTLMNIISKSKKEKVVMTPLSLLAAVSYWVVAFQMPLSQ